MSEKNNSIVIPIFPILGLLFVWAKLAGHITWSWWWVTCPFWGPIAALVALLLVCAIIVGLGTIINK